MDVSGSDDRLRRTVHCSQFLLNFDESFPAKAIAIVFSAKPQGAVKLSITKEQAGTLSNDNDPLGKLAEMFKVETVQTAKSSAHQP